MSLDPVRPAVAVVVALTLVGTVFAAVPPIQQAPQDAGTQETGWLRVVHASPDAPAVDVYVDNSSYLSNVAFGTVSDYEALEEDDYNVTITAAGDRDAVVFHGEVEVDPREAQTLAASGEIAPNSTVGFEPIVVNNDALRPPANESAVGVVHLAPDAPGVDVTTAAGAELADNVTFRDDSGYVSVPAGDHTIQIREDTPDENGTIVESVTVTLENRTVYSAMAVGYLDPTGDQQPFQVVLAEDAAKTFYFPGMATNETAGPGANATGQ